MIHSHSAPLQKAPAALEAGESARAVREGFSLLRLSAADRALGAIFIIALLWASVYWALH